ncbi:sulfatase-like hydrolase/transferase [Lentisphaera profundi]|uniref:Sulfatase-like hydrolase/transferase n=1 Tax=Lentisphaera profundi TaxID=1658616 RepID=A0ABY7VYF8_9BACT|nr:sulfatase-like hydrolase/transferase [Lentisphaera profundi]WDE99275.1 sulfatase-like hydrolase/transferase [Lentisphaera profundi]
MSKIISILLFLSTYIIAASDKPNIILIMADDVGWEAFGSYGTEDYKTPNLDALAANGVQFNHCYSTPICTTSRVMIMTGQYNFRNYTHFGYLNPKEKTFGNLLQENGYKTAIAGKWQLNGLYNKLPGHDDKTRPYKAGFDEYCLWQLTKEKKSGGERFWSPMLEKNGEEISKDTNKDLFGPDIFSDFICDFMERHKDEPFFIYYPMVLVHDPFIPSPDTVGNASRGAERNKEPKDKKQRKANFVSMVEYTDKIIGKIRKKLEEISQSENTIILFTADNGTHPKITSNWKGQEVKGGKGGMTDPGTHVPLIVSWEGKSLKSAKTDALVDFTDFYTTFAEIANIDLGENDPIDGYSFLPQLLGNKSTRRDFVLCHYQPYWNKKPGQFARTAKYKLYRDGRFYETAKDLTERNDLSKKMNSEVMMTAHEKLKSFLDTCPPAPENIKADKNTKQRPTYPNHKKL